MRRSLAEWLLVPLFLLPVGVGLGLVLLARGTYLSEVERVRRDGVTEVRMRLERAPGGAEAWRRTLLSLGPTAADLSDDEILLRREREDGEPFRCVVRTGVSVRDGPEGRVWRIGGTLPVGLGAADLADPELRLRVETGESVPGREAVDDATRRIADLLADPDLPRLRSSRLALSTKLFLVRRWRRDDPVVADLLRETERGLALGLRVLRWFDARTEAPGPGVHRVGATTVCAGRNVLTASLDPSAVFGPRVISRSATPEDPFELECVLVAPRPAAGEVLWEGRLEEPVAGTWRVVAVHGRAWWRTATFRRWAGPVAGGLLAYLLVPAALLVSIRRRRRLDEARRRFITELAHDLRTPLSSVRLYAEMLESGRVANGDRDEYVSVLARESARLSSLLANLLDLSRLDRGRRSFERRSVDVAAIVADAARDFLALEPGREEDLTTDGPSPCPAIADREALARALANLLENAGKFTSAGTRVELRWRPEGEHVILEIADEGPGIPPAERARLFTRFARGAGAARDGVPGTGLGLSLVKELIEGSGGSVRLVESTGGATFEVRLARTADG